MPYSTVGTAGKIKGNSVGIYLDAGTLTAPDSFVAGDGDVDIVNADNYSGTGGELIACSTSCTYSISNDTISTACKDNDGRASFEAGQQTHEMSIDGLTAFDNFGRAELFAAAADKSDIKVVYGTGVAGDPFVSGRGIITSFEESASVNDIVTYSVSISLKGETITHGFFGGTTGEEGTDVTVS